MSARPLPPAPSPRGLFLTDLDETLLATDRTLPARNLVAIREAIAARVVFAIVTGRRASKLAEVFPLLEGLPFRIAAANGAVLLDAGRDRQQVLEQLPWSLAHEVACADGLERRALLCIAASEAVEHDREVLVLDEERRWHRSPTPFRRETWAPSEAPGEDHAPLVHLAFLFEQRGRAERAAIELARTVAGRAALHVVKNPVDTEGALLELVPKGGKGLAARALGRALGLGPERIAAIGDEANDCDLLDAAAHRFAVGGSVLAARRPDALAVGPAARGAVADAIGHFLARLDSLPG